MLGHFGSNSYPIFFLFQALTVVSISSMADHGSYRKKQLVVFSALGSIATMLIGAMPYVWMAGALSVIANVSFGAGIVCFNAYLPLLVRNIEQLRHKRDQLTKIEGEIEGENERRLADRRNGDDTGLALSDRIGVTEVAAALEEDEGDRRRRSNETLVTGQPVSNLSLEQKKRLHSEISEQLSEEKGQLMGQISARGFASGYFGGILLLLVCLYISYLDKSSMWSLKFGIFLSGLWWCLFAGLAGVWLKERPGRELILSDRDRKRGSLWVASRYVVYSWNRVGGTIVQARKLPNAFAFLISWFFLSDGYTSIANVAVLFAKTSLRLSQTLLILLSLVVPICALIGTLAFPRLQRAIRYDQKQMVMLLLILLVMVPMYGTLGLILPFWPKLSTAKELFALAAYYGFLIGAIQRYGLRLSTETCWAHQFAQGKPGFLITMCTSIFFLKKIAFVAQCLRIWYRRDESPSFSVCMRLRTREAAGSDHWRLLRSQMPHKRSGMPLFSCWCC